jgi:hypothetical protein
MSFDEFMQLGIPLSPGAAAAFPGVMGLAIAGAAYIYYRWETRRARDRKLNRTSGDMTGGDIVGRNYNVGKMTINGLTIEGDFRNVNVINGRVIVDGVDYAEQIGKHGGVLEIKVLEGTIGELHTSAAVVCQNVTGNVDAGGSVTCGAIGGDVDSGGSVKSGNIMGSVDSGGSVTCGTIGGSVDAGGSVRHG